METPVEIFNEVLASNPKLGGRFHPIPADVAEPFHQQVDVFKKRMDWVSTQFLPNRDVPVHLDFIDNGRCNAWACIHKSTGLIGLYRGLILLPRDLFWRMFSHPGFLPDLGNFQEERRGAQHSDGMEDNYDTLVEKRRKANRPIHAKPPANAARARTADVCMDLTWRFIAAHELVHILHGHCDYIASAYMMPFILEATQSVTVPQISRYALDRQSLEVSADAVAARFVLLGFLNKSPLVGRYAGLKNVRDKLFIWSLTLFTLYRLWDFSIDPATLHLGTYPPSAVRFAILMTFVTYDAVAESVGMEGDEYIKIVKAGQLAAENGIAYCGGARLRDEDLEALRDPRVKTHREMLFEHFDDVLYPELEQRARIAIRPVSPA